MSKPLGVSYWKLWTASVVSNLGDGVSSVAYPWLASAITRNPLHIAAVAVVTRLPWLLFSLPAGVVTDRVDRRKLAAWMDVFRFIFTLGVAFVVLASQSALAAPGEIAAGTAAPPANAALLLVLVYAAAVLLGTAEVFRDNSAQTLLPAIVEKESLEKANGRMWGAEMVMNSFIGPPLAGVLIGIAFSLPFFIDAGTFAVAAALVFLIAGEFTPKKDPDEVSEVASSFWGDLKEGVRWLWGHPLFRPMAIALGILNGTMMMSLAT
ncbi:MAG TPA: MFS transporter, partial [Acidimicrobiia bacterium]